MPTKTTQEDKLEMLKGLLFTSEQEALEDIGSKVQLLEKALEDQKKSVHQIDSLVDKKLEINSQKLQDSLGPSLQTILKKEIRSNPEEMTVLLAPLMSSLMKEYKKQKQQNFLYKLNTPIRGLRKFGDSFSTWFKGGSDEAVLQNQLKSAVIEQVLIIDRKTDHLIASYAETKKLDKGKISEICDVIQEHIQKSALKEDQHLESVSFQQYQIHLQGFVNHYVALIISGKKELRCKAKLQDIIFNFYYKYMATHLEILKDAKDAAKEKKIIDKDLLEIAMAESFESTSS